MQCVSSQIYKVYRCCLHTACTFDPHFFLCLTSQDVGDAVQGDASDGYFVPPSKGMSQAQVRGILGSSVFRIIYFLCQCVFWSQRPLQSNVKNMFLKPSPGLAGFKQGAYLREVLSVDVEQFLSSIDSFFSPCFARFGVIILVFLLIIFWEDHLRVL